MEKTPCKNVVSPHNCEYHWSEKIPFMSHSIMPDRVSTELGNGWINRVLQSLIIAIVFGLIYYTNGCPRAWLTSINIDQKCHAFTL